MSAVATPSISLPNLATTLRAALSAEQQLTLNPETLGEQTSPALLGFLGVDALTLAAAQVTEIADGLTVSGRASMLALAELDVTLTVTAPDGGVGLSLRATPGGTAAVQLPGLSFLSVGQLVVAVDVLWTPNTQSFSGKVTGTIRLGELDVPVAISLPAQPQGLRIVGTLEGSSGPGLSALAATIDGIDFASALPDGLGNLLVVRRFEILVGEHPFLAFTLVSTQPLELIPGTLSIESAELSASVRSATAEEPRSFDVRIKALLRMGTNTLPIDLGKDESTGEWIVNLTAFEVPLPGLAELAALLGGADQIESLMPGLDGFGALTLSNMQLRVDLARRILSSLSFSAAAQNEWTLPMFGAVSFGRPTLSLSVSGLGFLPSAAASTSPSTESAEIQPVHPVPYLAFRLSSAKSWSLLSDSLTLDRVELFIGVILATAKSPRSVMTRVEATLQLGQLALPITLSTDGSTGKWVLRLDSPMVRLPGLDDLAALFGGADAIASLLPGLEAFGAPALTGLELRIDPASHAVSSLSFAMAATEDWVVPFFEKSALRGTRVALTLANPASSSRAVTGSIDAVLTLCGIEFAIAARKDSPAAAWHFTGRTRIGTQLSLTALAGEFLGASLPPGMPELSFADVEMTMTPAASEFTLSGRSPTPWLLPLGESEISLSNVELSLNRRKVGAQHQTALTVSGALAVGNTSATLRLTLGAGFQLSADLPPILLSEILSALGAFAVLQGLGLPTAFFALALGPSTLSLDGAAKSASLSGSATGFERFELQLRRDARGQTGAALALKPQAGLNLQELLGVPGLDGFALTNLVFVLSSLHDPALRFSSPAFAAVGTVSRGFGFSAQVSIAPLGIGVIPGLPTAPIAMQAHFGRSLAEFTLAAALSAPGDRFVLDPASGLCLIDPELRISPSAGEICVAGKIEVVLDAQTLAFTGGFKLRNGRAALSATMPGEWVRPFGVSGVVVRDLALELSLPGLPSLKGTLQLGRTLGSMTVKPDPVAPVLDLRVESLDLHDLISSVCAPGLADVPAAFRQTLADVRIDHAQIYIAPRDTLVGDIPCAAGVTVAGKMSIWGLAVDARVQTTQVGALRGLLAEGLVTLPDLGGGLVVRGGVDAQGQRRSGPYLKLVLSPGQAPRVVISAEVELLGVKVSSVDIELNDVGFRATLSGRLLGGTVGATLVVSGGRLGPGAKYTVAAELDASSMSALCNQARQSLSQAIAGARQELTRAQSLLDAVLARGLALSQEIDAQRALVQRERDRDAESLRQAESTLQTRSAEADALLRSLLAARSTVLAERAEVDRRIAAAQNDVNAAAAAVSALQQEINSTERWFRALPKIDVPWKESQAREGTWFGLKMAGLYTARDSATGTLNVASRALQAVRDTQRSFPVDVDPRVAGILASHTAAQATLQAAQDSVTLLRSSVQLIPIDADFRVAAVRGLQQAQTLQLVAAQGALDLARNALTGIASVTDSLVPSITIRRAYFAGELTALSGGKVRLGLELTTEQEPRSFTVAYDFNDPLKSAAEIINRLLGTDTQQAISAAAQSTAAASSTVATAEQTALPTGSVVAIRCKANDQLVRVVGKRLVRFGDTVTLAACFGQYLCAERNGDLNADRTAIGPWEKFVLLNPYDLNSRDFVRYGDRICLLSAHGRYVSTQPGPAIKAYSASITDYEVWVIVRAVDINARDEVDLDQTIALRSWMWTYLGATSGGGGGTVSNAAVSDYENWKLLDHTSWDNLNFSLVTRGNDTADQACLFELHRAGEWLGFRSLKRNQFLIINDYRQAFGLTAQFGSVSDFEHFRIENTALWNRRQQRYLRLAGEPALEPHFLDGQGTLRGDPSCQFEIFKVADSVAALQAQASGGSGIFTTSSASGTTLSTIPATTASSGATGQPTASELLTSSQQKSALLGDAAAATGPGAERTADGQATRLRTDGELAVEPAQQRLAQAEADRRARRQRTLEKAARGSRAAADGFRDGALRFDGRSYLEAPATRPVLSAAGVAHAPSIALGTRFTIEAWICPESLRSEQSTILSKWRGDSEDELRFSLTQDGRLQLAWQLAGTPNLSAPRDPFCQSEEAVRFDAWSHVAAVRDGDTISLYIDGRQVGRARGLGSNPVRVGACNWRIGAQEGSEVGSFVGLIDSIRIWDHARSAASVRAQRFLVSRGDEAGLLACWNCDEPSGDTAFDAGPRELHARLVGRVHRTSAGAPEGPPLSDRYLTLAGGAYARLGDLDLFAGGTALTIEAWVRAEQVSEDFATILGKWAQAEDDEFLFALSASGKLLFAWRTQGGTAYGTPGWNHVLSDGTVALKRWCHVAVVRQGQAVRFYCDGGPIGASDSADTLPLRRGATPLCIGSERGRVRSFEGSLAEVRVLRRAVSDSELRDHFLRPFAGDEPDLAALWRCDEGTGRVVRDAAPSGHHGTLVGPVSWPARGGPPRRVGPSRGMRFSGSQYLEFGDADEFSPGVALTIESFLHAEVIVEDFTSIVNKWTQSEDSEYLFGLMPDGRLAFAWHTTGSNAYGTPGFGHVFSQGKIVLGRFTHVAVVRAGQRVSFFIDGKDAGFSDAADLEPLVNTTARLRIGAEAGGGGRYLRGTLTSLRIWRTARTQEQLCAAMSGLVSSRAPGRILDLRFDEGEGDRVLDAATGRIGQCMGQPLPQFVATPLPVRLLEVSVAEPIDLWLQPALDAARHCRETGVLAPAAVSEVDAALARLERPTHAQVTSLLAKAGYAPQELAAALGMVWGHDAAAVARLFYAAGRPALEALVATKAALAQAAGASELTAMRLVNAAGYVPESLGSALCEVFLQDGRAVAKLYLDAGLPCADAARAAWATLGRHTLPCFSALVEALLAAGHPPSAVGQALQEEFGCDASTIARAVLRSGGSADVAIAAAGEADVIPAAPSSRRYYVYDAKHRWYLVAADSYDQHVYHEVTNDRPNAVWTLQAVEGGGFLLRDEKHGKCLVAGDVYDGRVYHQDPAGRPNAVWDKHRADDDSFFLIDQKHGKALVTGDVPDGTVSHADPGERPNARWVLFPVPDLTNALRETSGSVLYLVTPAGELLLYHHTAEGRFDVRGTKLDIGWSDAVRILAARDGHLYVVRTDGALLYYHHDTSGRFDVRARVIDAGWTDFSWVGVGRFGRLYCVNGSGDLLLYEHDASLSWTTRARVIGNSWMSFTRIFTGGSGRLYAVNFDGQLLYYQHDEAMGWLKEAVPMGGGWGEHASLSSNGNGEIYAVTRSGELWLYRHDDPLGVLANSGRLWATNLSVADSQIAQLGWAAGTATIGASLGAVPSKSTLVTSPNLPTGPLIFATAQGGAFPDTFSLSTLEVGGSSFLANCVRVDGAPGLGTWGQELKLGWLSLSPTCRAHLQCRSLRIGSSGSQGVSVRCDFPQPFATVPSVLLTARGLGYVDTYVVSTRGVSTTGFQASVLRADAPTGWGQPLALDWLAFDSLLDLPGIEAQGGIATVGPHRSASARVLTVSVTFAQPFTQPPVVLLTPRGEAHDDSFAATATSITTQGFQANVVRMDGPIAWDQNLQLDWLAVVPPAPGSVRAQACRLIVPGR